MKKALLIATMILGSLSLAGCGTKVDPNEGGKLEAFASCTAGKGLKMYGTERCPHCQKMKEMFGTAFAKITYIDCDSQKVQCDVAKIEGYPTWMFNGQLYPGEKTLDELSKLTSCALPVEGETTGAAK